MEQHHVFPWWAGYLLINPMRKRSLDPEKLLGHYIEPGIITERGFVVVETLLRGNNNTAVIIKVWDK